jgi:diguanylate cyclase (GGDEF)-like protein
MPRPRRPSLPTSASVDKGAPAEPGQTSDDRDRVADDRDQASEAHEKEAEARDDRADARDHTAEARDRAAAGSVDADVLSDRAEALRDRRGAARDRAHAAEDREAAWSDRAVSADERMVSSIDGLTGVHRRDAGVVELEREIARAQRTEQTYVIAFVDVDGLKVRNDTLGHAAGDVLLRRVADSIRGHLRSYDLVVRFGGDEFVCGLFDLTLEESLARFALVNADLGRVHGASVTVGLAELDGDDSLEELIARADAALYEERERRAAPPAPVGEDDTC